MSGYQGNWEHLQDELRRLDLLLERAIAASGAARVGDPFEQLRGLVISNEEVASLLSGGAAPDRERSSAVRSIDERLAALERKVAARLEPSADLALPRLAHRMQLSAFETQALVLCLAPEIARKYDKLYAYLQDDVTRKRPTVGLALDLFCSTPDERLAARAAFADGARLVRHRLVRLTDVGQDGPQPVLGRALKLDDRIVAHLLGDDRLDARLAGCARVDWPDRVAGSAPAALEGRVREMVRRFADGRSGGRRQLLVHLRGPHGSGKRAVAAAAAAELGLPLLVVSAERLTGSTLSATEAVELVAREAFLQPAVLVLAGFDALLAEDPERRQLLGVLLDALAIFGRFTFVLGHERWRPQDRPSGTLLVEVAVPRADEAEQAAHWRRRLGEQAEPSALEPAGLASEFRFTPGQIDAAVAAAADLASWRGRDDGRVEAQDVLDAARSQASPELGRLARRVELRATWDDLVLPADQMAQLREICDQARFRATVFGAWGFGRKLSLGKGLSALFSGPPGTGKTLAASIVSRELGRELFKIDLSQVVSKYIGETEKNLDRIFGAAEDSSAVLFFDEADALFGKRSEVRDSHDRYANVEVSYLLQKMEEHEGVAILATNLRQHLDDAFARRLSSVVEFPFPDVADRERIWRASIPAAAPLADDVDLGRLAREVRLAGGNIKNISLAAAFVAAADGQVIRMDHLWHAAHREFGKLGRSWSGPLAGSAS
jgi:SpoVK/Ycf46/Vps4 family AAA+-type ATPase